MIRLHVGKNVERCDLRAEELERRPVLFFLELFLKRIGIGQDLQPLFFGRRELRPRLPAPGKQQPPRHEYRSRRGDTDVVNHIHNVGRFLFASDRSKTTPAEFVRCLPRV